MRRGMGTSVTADNRTVVGHTKERILLGNGGSLLRAAQVSFADTAEEIAESKGFHDDPHDSNGEPTPLDKLYR